MLRRFHRLTLALLAVLSCIPAFSQKKQDDQDSLVVLMNAKSLELLQINGRDVRKTIDARFLHNNTYLICDTALWHVDDKIINAFGNVKILQQQTVLTSDKLDYYVDEDLAKFRGTLVQLQDKDKNTLRTNNLDYNTKDSVAVFFDGGAMKDKDGEVIESLSGTYDSKEKTFTFSDNVNMYVDSVFVKTSRLTYDSPTSTATFHSYIDAWKDDNMLSALNGRYDRKNEIFFFWNGVHAMSKSQEGWADSLYFYRNKNNILMLGNAQVTDTTRNVNGLAERIFYEDSLARVTMTRDAAIIARTEENEKVDTVYFGADQLMYWTKKKCDVDSLSLVESKNRLAEISTDPVQAYRQRAYEAAQKAAEEALKQMNDPNRRQGGAKADSTKVSKESGPKERQYRPSLRSRMAERKKIREQKKAAKEATRKKDIVEDLMIDKEELAGDSGAAAPSTPSAPSDSLLTSSASPKDSLAATDSLALRDSIPASFRSTNLDSLRAGADSLRAGADSLSSGSDSLGGKRDSLGAGADSLGAGADSLGAGADSPAAGADSLKGPLDTTKIGFVVALGKVRLYRDDMQFRCDSLVYTDLDSLARLYIDPIVWNEKGAHQYTSDSLTVVIADGRMQKASLTSNAFVAIEEEKDICYDQIRGAEILAFFDSTSAMTRFDVLGGSNAIFYLQENDAFATINKVESKMLSATFKDGEIERVHYYDSPKNDAYPTVQMPKAERIIKGFNWRPELRPKDRFDITSLQLRDTERRTYDAHPRTTFKETDRYFPGYMKGVYKYIARQDSLRAARQREEKAAKERETQKQPVAQVDSSKLADSLNLGSTLPVDDSLATRDSLMTGSESMETPSDSLQAPVDSLHAPIDSLAAPADSASAAPAQPEVKEKTKEELLEEYEAQRRAKWEAREAKRKAREAAKEARWAELDKRDAEKAAAKAAKEQQKLRLKKQKALKKAARREAKKEKVLQRYIEKYRKQKAREDARAAAKASKGHPKEEKSKD